MNNEEKLKVTVQEELKDSLSHTEENKEGLKSQLIEEEALSRGYSVKRLTFDVTIITVDGKDLLFKDMNGPLSSAAKNTVVDNKYVSRELLKQTQLTVPESTFLKIDERDKIKSFVEKIGYPVVLKPNNLARGKGVCIGINNDEILEKELDNMSKIVKDKEEKILIEKEFTGDDFRFFIVDDDVISVSKRARANVVGDGEKTVFELIEAKNQKRLMDRDMQFYLIPTDKEKLSKLYRDGNTLESIPKENEHIILRDESNISSGGEAVDFTDIAHSEFKDIAVQAIRSIPNLHYGGVDIIAKDITQRPTENNYILTEVEFSPGPISMFPWEGQTIDMAGPILDYYTDYLKQTDSRFV